MNKIWRYFCFLIIIGEALCHHDAIKQNKTVVVKNCCSKGRYNIDKKTCIDDNNNIYATSMLCKELIPFSDLEEDIDPDVENACIADTVSLDDKVKQEYFLCDEFENCCSSGKFDPTINTCVDPTTAKYTFSLFCRKVTSDRVLQNEIQGESASLFTKRICVEKISDEDATSEAYLTCEKINYELALTFEKWLYPFSIAFLVLTLYIYITELKDLRSSQDISFMYAILCLTLHMILHLARYSTNTVWIILVYNYAGRYFKTAYMAWFNVMLICRLFENRNLANLNFFSIDLRPIWCHFYGWFMPMVFIIVYYFNPRLNWHVPILCLWIINLLLLIAVVITVEYDRINFETLVWKRNHYRSWLLFRLFMGAGVLWIFGASYRIPIFTSLFALQGILIFLIMVIYRYNAKRMLGGVKLFGFAFPERWKNVSRIDEDDVPTNVYFSSDKGDSIRFPLDI